jgi:hypothetical protein
VHVAFNYLVKGGQKVRKDTKTHQDRWLALDPVSCAFIREATEAMDARLASVGLELAKDAYLFSNDPVHARPWNPDWVSHQVSDLADEAGVDLNIKKLDPRRPVRSAEHGFPTGARRRRGQHAEALRRPSLRGRPAGCGLPGRTNRRRSRAPS